MSSGSSKPSRSLLDLDGFDDLDGLDDFDDKEEHCEDRIVQRE